MTKESEIIKYLEELIRSKDAWIDGFVKEQMEYNEKLKQEIIELKKELKDGAS